MDKSKQKAILALAKERLADDVSSLELLTALAIEYPLVYDLAKEEAKKNGY